MAQLIDGKASSQAVNQESSEAVSRVQAEQGITPALTVVIVGEDPASQVYVRMKQKRADEIGIRSDKIALPEDTGQDELIRIISKLNNDKNVHGILVQSPLPSHLNEREVIEHIDPAKDVDCFHPYNVGKLLIGDRDSFFPCTPQGVMVLLQRYGIDPSGKHAVVLGRSNIVGKPMMALLVQKAQGANATVSVCHSRTRNIEEISKQADILIAAIGKTEFVTANMVKDGAVVIDVGVNRVEDSTAKKGYRLVGDVAFEEVEKKASYITPVPGGVGPMTIAMLMQNTIKACKNQNGIRD